VDRDEFVLVGFDAAAEQRQLTMSYILDALKKSEAERSRGVVPTLLSPQPTSSRSQTVGWIVAAALALNAACIGAWIYWPRTPAPNAASSSNDPTPTARIRSEPAVASAAADPEQRRAPAYSMPIDQPRSERIEPPTASVASTGLPATASAGANTVDAPRYAFSTHVYADDPSMRAVTLNGRRYVEGDTLEPGVRIQSITETGVVLDVSGRSVSVDVLQDWR